MANGLCASCGVNPCRPNGRTCRNCHAQQSRESRAHTKSDLASLIAIVHEMKDELDEIRDNQRKGPKRMEPTTKEERRHA